MHTTMTTTTQAHDILAALGAGWSVEAGQGWHQLRHADGYGAHLTWKDGRLRISGIWPRNAAGATVTPASYENLPDATITVAATRGAAAIAREITGRFLPVYLPAYQAQVAKAAEQDDYAARTAATLAALRAATHAVPRDREGNVIYLPQHHGYRVLANGDTVAFDAFSCPLAVALAILPLLIKRDDDAPRETHIAGWRQEEE